MVVVVIGGAEKVVFREEREEKEGGLSELGRLCPKSLPSTGRKLFTSRFFCRAAYPVEIFLDLFSSPCHPSTSQPPSSRALLSV